MLHFVAQNAKYFKKKKKLILFCDYNGPTIVMTPKKKKQHKQKAFEVRIKLKKEKLWIIF